jgi:hypothetical protein
MNRLTVLQLLPLAIAVALSLWWASRNVGVGRDESSTYWRAAPLSRLKYLIAAQGFTGASVAFFFDLLRGGTADRKEVVLLAVMAAVVVATLFCCGREGRDGCVGSPWASSSSP